MQVQSARPRLKKKVSCKHKRFLSKKYIILLKLVWLTDARGRCSALGEAVALFCRILPFPTPLTAWPFPFDLVLTTEPKEEAGDSGSSSSYFLLRGAGVRALPFIFRLGEVEVEAMGCCVMIAAGLGCEEDP